MIKNIVFDVGKVLVDFRWYKLMQSLSFSEETIHKLEKAIIRDPLWQELDRGVMPEEEIMKQYREKNKEFQKEIDLFFDNIIDVVRQFDYVQEWLKELKRRGYHLYYLSNYSASSWELHKKTRFKWYPLMEGGVVSAQVKLIKPDPAIYKLFLDTYQLDASECVFLDDRMVNVEGAREVGMHAIRFESYEQASKELNKLLLENA